MLTITADMFRSLADAQLQRFLDESVTALRAALPAETADFDDARLRAMVTRNLTDLQEIGFENTGDITRALHMLFRLQYGTAQPRMPADMVARFRSPSTSVQKKLETLEQVFIFGAA